MPVVSLVKPFCDALLSMVVLVAPLPVLAVVAMLVCVKIGSPVFFGEDRRLVRGTSFVYKFRTMTDERNGDDHLPPDSERLTHFVALMGGTSRRVCSDAAAHHAARLDRVLRHAARSPRTRRGDPGLRLLGYTTDKQDCSTRIGPSTYGLGIRDAVQPSKATSTHGGDERQ